MCIYIYIYICIHIHVYVHMYIHIHFNLCIVPQLRRSLFGPDGRQLFYTIYVCYHYIYIYIYIHIAISTSIYLYIIYIYIYIYAFIGLGGVFLVRMEFPCAVFWRPEALDGRVLIPPEAWSGLIPDPPCLGLEPQTFCISEPTLQPTELGNPET